MNIEHGHIYRAKKPKHVGFLDFYDDRQVLGRSGRMVVDSL